MRLERENQRLERERLQREKEELRRAQEKLEETKRQTLLKRPMPPSPPLPSKRHSSSTSRYDERYILVFKFNNVLFLLDVHSLCNISRWCGYQLNRFLNWRSRYFYFNISNK